MATPDLAPDATPRTTEPTGEKALRAHRAVMADSEDSFRQFMRNGVWGTCGGCPRDSTGRTYPEFCSDKGRSDHRLAPAQLFEQYTRLVQRT